ncbi:TonB-dependent receptor [Sphingobium sp. SCG-1]|uniref:TonB-dependent receptor plug domain-containing protein n=1 Tax=Sphingobium sp. SCG-1 TaxID=2072936 RepID=UPI000CD67883|nr:TonB-dependent receptor [Sphingobium sp. SCG-1]AUW58973.1 TonB-dependent receptor [Sphingobium sp. SCG-1]
MNKKLAFSVSSLAAILASPALALAQQPTTAPAISPAPDQAEPTVSDIVVTGSRIVRDGSQAPSPMTVSAAEDLNKVAPTSLIAGLTQLPQFSGSLTNTSARSIAAIVGNHGDFVNLHAIGAVRTLVLQDGRRLAPTTFTGLVDTSIIPQLLVKRVEVVTAGASATYGSDAVSGVVNFILDDKFKGLKGVVQGSIASRGDNENYRVALAYGAQLGDRINIVASVERYQTGGFQFQNRPPYGNYNIPVGSVPGGGTPGLLPNPLVDGRNIRFALATAGGNILTGPFANNVFTTSGVYRPIDVGTRTGSPGLFVGGDYHKWDGQWQAVPATTNTAFLRVNFEASDEITAFLQVNGAKTKQRYADGDGRVGQGQTLYPLNRTYFAENPFLPPAMAAGLAAAGETSFRMSRMILETANNGTHDDSKYYNAALGLKGDLGQFRWDLTYQHSWSKYRSRNQDMRQDRLAAATDAVLSPSGQIVCRPTLSLDPAVRDRFAGCLPLNLFGQGSGTQFADALAYVRDVSQYAAVTKLDNIAANVTGELFDLPAGPLSVAVGAEYRKSSLNMTSNSDPLILSDPAGLRNLPANAPRFLLNNFATANGSYEVKEAYGEVAIPILKDQSFAKSLELNAAARITDYSTSGTVTTWKGGAVWEVLDGLRFRATRSRDIRAPTLFDLFNRGAAIDATFFDPHLQKQIVVSRVTRGNSDLAPEVANTLSLGVVVQPRAVPGLTLSIDYYDVKLKGAIQTLNTDLAARTCEASGGTSSLCALIVRNPALPFSDRTDANAATAIINTPANLAGLKTRGFDIEASYRRPMLGGDLATRLFVTYVDRYTIQDSALQAPVELAGWTEGIISSVGASVPKVRASLQATYSTDGFSVTAQERMVGRMKRGPINIWAERDLPAVFYTDLTLSYRFGPERATELFLTANNLFDRKPPFIATGPSPGLYMATLTDVYDTVGLAFTAGVRFKF